MRRDGPAAPAGRPGGPPPEPPPSRPDALRDRPGTAYLASLRARIEGEGARSAGAARASEAIREALAGLSRRSVVELPGPGRERLVSLSFLVPRSGLDAFSLAVRDLEGRTPGKLLLTGPWPPYNFAGAGPVSR